jgi:hypothetical protein
VQRRAWDNAPVPDRDERIQDCRQFTRELLARFDRSMRDASREWRAHHEEAMANLAEMRAESRAHHERESRRIDEIIAENRAQRRALLAILDRMEGNGGPAAAT